MGCQVALQKSITNFSFSLGQFQGLRPLFAIHWYLAFHRYYYTLLHLPGSFWFIKFSLLKKTYNLILIMQAFSVYSNVWLAKWSEAGNTTTAERDLYLGVYGALGFGQGKKK